MEYNIEAARKFIKCFFIPLLGHFRVKILNDSSAIFKNIASNYLKNDL